MDNRRETVPALRTGSREWTIAEVRPSSVHGEQSSPGIVVLARTWRNESQWSNRAGTLEQLHEVTELVLDAEWDWQPVENIT